MGGLLSDSAIRKTPSWPGETARRLLATAAALASRNIRVRYWTRTTRLSGEQSLASLIGAAIGAAATTILNKWPRPESNYYGLHGEIDWSRHRRHRIRHSLHRPRPCHHRRSLD